MTQTIHHYPYGGTLTHSTNLGVQKYKYNGKEFDRTHGLDWYDYSARQYDLASGRFTSMDPLCEKYYNISPYSYCAGNPVNRIDPDGRDWYQFGEQRIWRNSTDDSYKDKDRNIWKNIGHTYTDDKSGTYYSLFGQKYDATDKSKTAIQKIDQIIEDLSKGKSENFNSLDGSFPFDDNLLKDHKENFYYGINKDQINGKNAHMWIRNNHASNTPNYVSIHKIDIHGYGLGEISGYGIEMSKNDWLVFYATYPIKTYNKIVSFYNKLVEQHKNSNQK